MGKKKTVHHDKRPCHVVREIGDRGDVVVEYDDDQGGQCRVPIGDVGSRLTSDPSE